MAENYSYDTTGNLTSHPDRNGNVISYTHDALNWPTQARYNSPGMPGLALQSSAMYAWRCRQPDG